jgi:hypothetical protein
MTKVLTIRPYVQRRDAALASSASISVRTWAQVSRPAPIWLAVLDCDRRRDVTTLKAVLAEVLDGLLAVQRLALQPRVRPQVLSVQSRLDSRCLQERSRREQPAFEVKASAQLAAKARALSRPLQRGLWTSPAAHY